MPIPGTTKLLHRRGENVAATNAVLTAANLIAIDSALATIDIEGGRYPTHLLAATGR